MFYNSFTYKIADLLKCFPCDYIDYNGRKFWSGSHKRCPETI